MYIHRSFSVALFSMVMGIGAFFASSLPASATDYFVSKNGNNADGHSWATAWNELNQIHWDQLNSDDVIYIDGGTSRMVYNTPLNGGFWIHGYTARAGYHAQHDGQVVIDGRGAPTFGVEMNAGNCSLTAKRRSGIVVTGFLNGAIMTSSQSGLMKHVEIYGNARNGVMITGQNAVVDQCVIRDNGSALSASKTPAANLVFMPVYNAPYNQNRLRNSWVYNSIQNLADGVVDKGSTLSTTNIVSNCVIGPGLRDGYRAETGVGVVANSLLLNASRNSIAFAVHGGGIENCTTVMTKKNATGMAHSCLYARQASSNQNEMLIAERSVFFRGDVNAPADMTHFVNGNKQYQVTGNTMILAPTQEDPRFAQPSVYSFPDNVPLQTLIDTDYSLLTSRPVPSTIGSPVTSVKQLLRDFMPSDP